MTAATPLVSRPSPRHPADRAAVAAQHGNGTPALQLEAAWKLFGAVRRRRLALQAIGHGAHGDRTSLARDFDVFAAVAGVTLDVRPYEILAIVGASGSGKSTVVRHMNGLIRPDHGRVSVNGQSIDQMTRRELLHLRSTRVGMVFQNTSLFPHRTVLDNVVFGLEARGVARPQRYAVAQEWLERVELGAWGRHYPSALSGGMQQRVGLARTFATDPQILLLDEPFSALDPHIRRSLQDQFVSLVRTYRKTAVFITHDFAEAVRVADRIGVMSEGRIIQIDTPHDVIMRPVSSYVAGFATPELKRALVTAADIAVAPGLRASAALPCLAGTAPLTDIIARLRASDAVLKVMGDGGTALGIIDRNVLLDFLDNSLCQER